MYLDMLCYIAREKIWGDEVNVKCILCDKVEQIEKNSLYAKKLRSDYLKLHLCKSCNERITKRTKSRHKTGKLKLYKTKKKDKYMYNKKVNKMIYITNCSILHYKYYPLH